MFLINVINKVNNVLLLYFSSLFTSLLKKTKTNNALSVPTGQSVGHNTFASTEDVNISKGVTTAKHCFFFLLPQQE